MLDELKVKIRVADWLIRQGLRVFLVYGLDADGNCLCGDAGCTAPAKHPMRSFKRFYRTDIEKLRQDLLKHPRANLAVRTGYYAHLGVSLLVIDQDDPASRHLVKLPLDATLNYKTGKTTGRHFWFWLPGDVNEETGLNRRFVRQAIGFVPGFDLKCQDNYVIVPPSRNRSGQYAFDEDSYFPISELTVAEYRWIESQVAAARTTGRRLSSAVKRFATGKLPKVKFETVVRDGIRAGSRNSTITFLVMERLRLVNTDQERWRIAWEFALDCNDLCDTPLDQAELRRIVRSAVGSFRETKVGAKNHLEQARDLFGKRANLVRRCFSIDRGSRMTLTSVLDHLNLAIASEGGSKGGCEYVTVCSHNLLLLRYFLQDLFGEELVKKRGDVSSRYNLRVNSSSPVFEAVNDRVLSIKTGTSG